MARGPTLGLSGDGPNGLFARDYSSLVARAEDASSLLDNGRTTEVQWDEYSLLLRGQRIFLWSGEFHTYRLPVPDLWLDVLQKAKAAGLNAVSVYTHWGQINPSPGVIDFDGFRALAPLYEAARKAGIFIVLRPGPYINAETTAGGIAHWVTSQVAGNLRTNATDYFKSWQDYIHGIIDETSSFQITADGPVIAVQIDNEYSQNSRTAPYFQALEDVYHNSSIVVPLTYNDPGEGKNFVNGTGAVDIYGFDSYPQLFDCSNPDKWNPVPTNWHDYHEGTNPSQPLYFPEFQGGAFDAWGPTAPGYPNCRVLTGADFVSVFYKALWAANVKLASFYMFYGGTSWGAIPFPGVYTSYDYGAHLTESRDVTAKYSELKLQGLFLRSSPDFYKTNWIGNSSTGVVKVSNPGALVVKLQNPDTNATFYIARHADSTSTGSTIFNITVPTSAGTLTIPQTVSGIALDGRESKTIVTDYTYGSSGTLLYSTAQILFAGTIGTRDVLFLYGTSGQSHEFAVNSTPISFPTGVKGGPVTVVDVDDSLILFSDVPTASSFFNPVLASGGPLGNYWGLGTNSSVLVGGPRFVRNASLSPDGATLALQGDLNVSAPLVVIGPTTLSAVTWNGVSVDGDTAAASNISAVGGIFVGQLTLDSTDDIQVPELTGWKFANSLPEAAADFDDSNFTLADHTKTNIVPGPAFGDGRVLYGCDYGFCENIVLWRGHFNATGGETSVNLSINGGQAFAASVFLNSVFLGTAFGNSTNDRNAIVEVDQVYNFPAGAVTAGADNVITIVQDNMGLDEASSVVSEKSSRGVRGFKLNPSGHFSEWRVQGKLGGYTDFPDRVRGVMNDGGLFGEREGWHLPGFDTSSWVSRDLSEGLPNKTAGVGFFVTTFDLALPSGFDILLSFNFDGNSAATDVPYRAYLFVNGWMMGKRVANLGPQTKFPVHQGILEYNGTNTVAVALWAMEPVKIAPTLNLTIDTILQGGPGAVSTNNPTWIELRG
ncbi:glycoside hydrolase family 35 protein [Vararia minispora EC-137]|uniref:Glycoside hydrolase family 35 protein n=1 Tax=Vararia minispora EC-137 TaxID=1314806 RepID=A0ACB8QN83_9AGAM|nr:glycoside hydrolase family 35 protein [Vararia minispora EC-137]